MFESGVIRSRQAKVLRDSTKGMPDMRLHELRSNTDMVHVYPLNDLREHEMIRECWCRPDVDEDDGVCVHNALDGREAYENGERKVN